MSDEKPDLVALMEHYDVNVRGRNKQMVSCPLHDDRTPSCSLDTDKGLWSCKSCGEGGDSYNLIQLKEETDFVGARAFAATLGLATGGAGGGSEPVRGSAYGGGRRLASGKRNQRRDGGYVPAWRRS